MLSQPFTPILCSRTPAAAAVPVHLLVNCVQRDVRRLQRSWTGKGQVQEMQRRSLSLSPFAVHVYAVLHFHAKRCAVQQLAAAVAAAMAVAVPTAPFLSPSHCPCSSALFSCFHLRRANARSHFAATGAVAGRERESMLDHLLQEHCSRTRRRSL